MSNPRNGRGPNGRALNKDGTERKARTKRTEAEIVQKLAEDRIAAHAAIGRSKLATAGGPIAALLLAMTTFRKWVREVTKFSTPEGLAAIREYHEAALAAIDAKAEIAQAWLPDSQATLSMLDDLPVKVGRAFERYQEDNGTFPDDEEMAAVIEGLMEGYDTSAIEARTGPDADPFAAFRRKAKDSDETVEDSGEEEL